MLSLLDCQSREDYFTICDLLIASDDSSEDVKKWARQKKLDSICSGINVHCSKIPPDIFLNARNHTNAVEQTHHKSNASGKRLSLLQAVQRGQRLDERDLAQYSAFHEKGVRHGYRQTSASERFYNSEKRERNKRGRKRKRQEDQETRDNNNNDNIDDSDNADILSQYSSSSSYIFRGSRSRRGRGSQQRTSSRGSQRSSHLSLQRLASQNQQNRQNVSRETTLAYRQQEAEIRRLEIENERAELENERAQLDIIRLRQDIQEKS
ncbi:hypothetical protein ABVK25_011191 [Lepraria finkii]|uniref:Uncharacterized protein n=1 Tax=Lepraria finkii TaxID=1340010 RepID=A0ABR4AQF7_9LECA